MIGLARSFSITNQRRTEPRTHSTMARPSPTTIDWVSTTPITEAQQPTIISPSRPRCQMPEREARTPAMVT